MSEQRFFYLTGRQLTGEATEAEREELSQLLREQEEWRRIYRTLFAKTRRSSDASGSPRQEAGYQSDAGVQSGDPGVQSDDPGAQSEDPGALDAQQAYAAHFVKMQLAGEFEQSAGEKAGERVRIKRRRYWMAAATVLVLGAGWWGIEKAICIECASSLPKNEVATRKGSRSRIVLPDGTLVWLNADSKIVYPDNFKGQIREVHLTGEAFFDVSKDASRPFIIHAGPIDVNVLGTSFNVRSYPREKKVETLLLHGAIEITLRNRHNRKILLQPNQKLSVPNDSLPEDPDQAGRLNAPVAGGGTDRVSLEKGHYQARDSSNIETLWVDNKLAFETEPLDVVAADIERWYNVEVIIRNENYDRSGLPGVFDNVRLQEVMEALKLTGGFNYSIKDNRQVIIY